MGQAIALLALVLVFQPQTRGVSVLSYAQAADGGAPVAAVLGGRAHFVPFGQYRVHGWPASVWLRFTVRNAELHDRRRWLIVLPRQIESAELYRDGKAQPRAGVFVPAYRLLDRDFRGGPLYLHVVYYPDVPLLVNAIGDFALFTWSEPYRLVEGAFIGVLIAVVLFNVFVFGMMRDKNALWYVLYLLAMIANELVTTGLGDMYLWPGAALDNRAAAIITNLLAFGAFLAFARSFLHTREEARAWDRALLVAFSAYGVLQSIEALAPGGSVLVGWVVAAQLSAMLVTVAAGISRLRAGYEPARFFVVAFVPSTIGVFANLYYNTFVPPGNWFWAANGVELGTMLQAAILSFSIIDRLRILDAVSEHARNMQQLALIDPLTGLPNRMHFTQELIRAVERARREGSKLAVLFVDLDRFKRINDAFGHRFGDEVLRTVALRLVERLRSSDLVGRLGGDEFAAILENVGSAERADCVKKQIASLLELPIVVEGERMPLGISVGAAIYPEDGRSMDELLHAADLRMYEMKQRARATA